MNRPGPSRPPAVINAERVAIRCAEPGCGRDLTASPCAECWAKLSGGAGIQRIPAT